MLHISGNPPRSLAKGKNGQNRPQKLGKGGTTFPNGQRNTYSYQDRGRGGQNPQRKGNFADKRPPAKALRQTERFNPVSIGIVCSLFIFFTSFLIALLLQLQSPKFGLVHHFRWYSWILFFLVGATGWWNAPWLWLSFDFKERFHVSESFVKFHVCSSPTNTSWLDRKKKNGWEMEPIQQRTVSTSKVCYIVGYLKE